MSMHEEWVSRFLARETYQMYHSGLPIAFPSMLGSNVMGGNDNKFDIGILMGTSI